MRFFVGLSKPNDEFGLSGWTWEDWRQVQHEAAIEGIVVLEANTKQWWPLNRYNGENKQVMLADVCDDDPFEPKWFNTPWGHTESMYPRLQYTDMLQIILTVEEVFGVSKFRSLVELHNDFCDRMENYAQPISLNLFGLTKDHDNALLSKVVMEFNAHWRGKGSVRCARVHDL